MSDRSADPSFVHALTPRPSRGWWILLRWRPARLLACALVAGTTIAAAGAEATARATPAAPPAQGDRFADRPLNSVRGSASGESESAPAGGPGFTRVALSLGGVVVLIIATGWLYRRLFARQQGGGGAISLVSRTLLTPRHQVLLVRAGRRLLVVGDSGQGMNLLCQITDAGEIAELLGEPADTTGAGELPVERALGETYEPLPGADASPFERAPSLEAARGEIRALIERVRGLGAAQPTEAQATKTAR